MGAGNGSKDGSRGRSRVWVWGGSKGWVQRWFQGMDVGRVKGWVQGWVQKGSRGGSRDWLQVSE